MSILLSFNCFYYIAKCKLINNYYSQMDFEMIYVAYTSIVKQSISCESSHSSFPSRHPFFDLSYLNRTRRFNGLESRTNINFVYVAKIKCRIYIIAKECIPVQYIASNTFSRSKPLLYICNKIIGLEKYVLSRFS